MSNPTSNFGWQMPTNTDLVSQLPADFEVFGQAVDTSLADLKGGTTGQVLTKATGTDMDFTWATPAAGKNYSLIGTGSLTSGSTVTVSGISNMDEILVVIAAASNTAGNTQVNLRINGDTASNYRQAYISFSSPAAYAASYMGNTYLAANTQISLGNINSAATDTLSGYLRLSGGATAGIKTYQMASGGNAALGNNAYNYIGGGVWNNTSTITSISLVSSGTFDAGSFLVYGSA